MYRAVHPLRPWSAGFGQAARECARFRRAFLPIGCCMPPASQPDIAVRLSDVRLDRGTRTVLSGIDLEVPRGSITAVLGPSGSGQSTLDRTSTRLNSSH